MTMIDPDPRLGTNARDFIRRGPKMVNIIIASL